MILQSTESRRGSVAALALGAYLHESGTRLRCGVLLLSAGQEGDTLTLETPDHQHQTRVRLPQQLLNQAANARIDRIELEVLP